MIAPTNLSHKPVLAVDGYDAIDGPHAGVSDAKALSVGLSQWDENEISGKVWRYSDINQRWVRGSEEMPVHRAIDLTIMIVSLIAARQTSSKSKQIGISHGNFNMSISQLNDRYSDQTFRNMLAKIDECLFENNRTVKPYIWNRIEALSEVIGNLQNNIVNADL